MRPTSDTATHSPVTESRLRIHVTGNAGAGKTTLGKKIGLACGLPVFGLDQIVWQPGWKKTAPELRDQQEEALVAKSDWVIEGVSHLVRRSADITIFLDVPRRKCLYRSFNRAIPYLFESRPELPDNCPEYKILPTLFRVIWHFPDRVRPVILDDMTAGYNIIDVADPDVFMNMDLAGYLGKLVGAGQRRAE